MTRRLLFFFVLLLSTSSLIAENVMTLTTSKAEGETINLMITLHPSAKEGAWVDLNNNDIKDASESVTDKVMTSYTIQSKIIKIHGIVTLLRCSENELTELDVSQNRDLVNLICFKNAISHLDVSQNNSLISLDCSFNQLVSLNIRNSHNSALKLNSRNNPKLSCIYADNACKLKSIRKDRIASLSNFECDPYVAVKNVTLSTEAIELDLNATYELSPQVSPWNATFKKLTYDSKDWGIAEVTPEGVIRAKAIGETDIIVYSYLKEKMAVCHVSVTAKSSITFTTSQSVPCTLHLFLYAEKKEIPKIWVDKNNNGNKDSGEAISINEMSDFAITSQTVTIYGDVLDFRCESSQVTSVDVSNNKKLQKLICHDNQLHSIDVSENPELIALGLNDNPISQIDVTHNPKLVSLECRRCKLISQIDVTQNPGLTHLMFSDNKVSTIDVSQNPELHTLVCDVNQLTTLDLSANTKLHTLDCSFNYGLNSLNVLNCFVLDNLSCSGNALKELDIKNNFELTSLDCFQNSLKSIDLSHNTLLKTLLCYENQLEALDLSANHVLTTLECKKNKLTALNLANGNNQNMNCEYCHMYAEENPDLTCIQVDKGFAPLWREGFRWYKPEDANYSDSPCPKIVKEQSKIVFTTEKGIGSKLKLKMLSGTSFSNPDIWIDLNDNGVRDEKENVVLRQEHEYSLAAKTITVYGDVTEFEYQGHIYGRYRDNFLTTLDVSHNKLLTKIVVPYNRLSTIDVSQQTQLNFLNVSNNILTSLNVMECNQLETLYCYCNQLTTLDLSTNTALSFVQCNNNQLQQMNLDGAENLSKLLCFNNTKLTQLDVSHNALLKELHCYYNPAFKQLDVSHNALLEILYLAGCQLTDLDVSSNSKLKKINCSGNALTKLNLANGSNSNILQSTAEYNPDLFCIQIDPGFTPNYAWTKDAIANYSSSDCSSYVPEYEVQVEDSKWFHFKTNHDVKRHKKDEAVNDYKDIMKVEAEKSVEENLNFKLHDFPERLFEVVAVDKDNENQDHFMTLTTIDDATKVFKMPRHKVRLTTKVVVKKNQTEAIPNQAYYLEFHEGASLKNKPVSGKTQVDDLVMYKRTFKPTNWYAISFPFDVTRVTVKDQDVEYDIYNCYSAKDPDGHYYLKYIQDGVEHNAIKRSWEFETSIQKNKSYIIAFPNAYFKDKEITFYGFSQEINDASNKFTEHPNLKGRHYNYRCNTSYNDQIIQDPYLLNAEGTYFIKYDGSYTLKPFMSYIYSVTDPLNAPRRLSMTDVLEPQKEPTTLDSSKENTLDYHIEGKQLFLKSSMDQMVKITKVNGQLVRHYTLTSNSVEIITLETGVYILSSSNNQAIKIIIL